MTKRIISLFCALTILFSGVSFMIPAYAAEVNYARIIEPSNIPLRLHYDEEASHGVAEGYDETDTWYTMDYKQVDKYNNDDWERWSLPIGNGYFGANLFGRTETERIQISEQSLYNTYKAKAPDGTSYEPGGYNSFSETYIDFGHTNSEVTDYSRWLDLKTALSGVSYSYQGVTYTREYFTSYPDKILVIRLDASETGKLNFTLRPTIPWEQEYAEYEGDGFSKYGTVTSYVADNGDGMIELSGKMGYYDIDFLGIYHVVTKDGEVKASSCTNADGDTDGTIEVSNATSAYIYVNIGTDYVLSEEMFTSSDKNKPTHSTGLDFTRTIVEKEASAVAAQINGKSYEEAYQTLKTNHYNDYNEIFSRVTLNLGDAEDAALTTDELLLRYKNGEYSAYLEALYFQYGRYLMIASSREDSLPANLQGVWNRYNKTPWSGGYWHNVNIQMNYWPAFSTNISETFEAYVKYNQAYMSTAESLADYQTNKNNPDASGLDGGNGWCIGIGTWPYSITGDSSPGNLGFTTQLYWEYYQYTKDETILSEIVYPILTSAARFIVKSVEKDENGNYLVANSDSPEMHVNGVWYRTKGTTYAQTFAYLNNYNALCAARDLGIDFTDTTHEDYEIYQTLMKQIDKYDPIIVGLSGQVKEFREEDYYCSIGDDPHHRHTSQLVGLYPGNIINSTTPAWLDAATVTLTERGDAGTGWGVAHKLNLWARTKDGNRAHDLLYKLLSTSTATNLWDLHPPFQIDGNAGGTAGIAEMLLQSHEGYIAPLAAMPDVWQSGSYTGLVARGNFEISAAWENGTATVFNITSKAGEKATVYYPSITNATVVTASGKAVTVTVEDKDMISFDTEIGETYIISGFTAQEKISTPSGLTIARKDVLGEFNFTWSAVSNAKKYNVYIAIESAPEYTLIGTTDSTSFSYTPAKEIENARLTFAITAVTAGGTESRRALCYSNPINVAAEIYDSRAYILESGEAQFVINANSNAEKFRLYSKAPGSTEYTFISESKTPVIKLPNYDSSLTYAISVIASYDGAESEITDIVDFAAYASDYNSQNIFAGKEFVQNDPSSKASPTSDVYPYANLTDGIIDPAHYNIGRYSSKTTSDASDPKIADAVIDLKDEYFLNEITFYLYENDTTKMGDNFKIEVYSQGKWVTVFENLKNDKNASNSLLDYVVVVGSGKDSHRLVFDLNGIRGEKIRFYAEALMSKSITFYEAECTGVLVENIFEVRNNILEGKVFVQEASASSGLNIKPIDGYEYAKLTDGIIDRADYKVGRYSSKDGGAGYATADLNGVYALDEIRFYYFNKKIDQAGTSYSLEVYYNGVWTTIVDNASIEQIQKSNINTTDGYIYFDLDGIKAEKIRFYVEATSKSVSYYEIECSGYCICEYVNQDGNIFIGKQFESELSTVVSVKPEGTYTFTYDKLTDGKNQTLGTAADWTEGRFSSKAGEPADGTIDLGEVYAINELRFYHFEKKIVNAGTNFTLEVYAGGAWTTVLSNIDNATLNSTYKHSSGQYLSFNLGGIKAEKIRFYADAYSDSSKTYSVTFCEIECYGSKIVNRTFESAYKNAFEEATVTVNGSNASKNANDGKLDTYVTSSATSGSYTVELSFATTKLFTLGVYEIIDNTSLVSGVASTASDKTKIEIYRDGLWLTVYDGVSLESDGYTEFSLYGTACDKVRITFTNTRKFDGESTYRCAKIAEIVCTPGKPNAPDRTPMIEAYEKLTKLNISTEAHKSKMELFRTYLTDYNLVDTNVEIYANEMKTYFESVKNDLVSDINFTPKTSVTLGAELVYNIYIPITSALKSFTIDGVTYDNPTSVTLADGKQYYHIAIALPANRSARDIVLRATVSSGENDFNGTWTMSIPKYASKVIAANTSTEEVTLVKDVLAYIKAAYIYFDSADKSEVSSTIDGILGTYTNTFSKVNGTVNINQGLWGVIISLEENPKMQFILPKGVTADRYTFKFAGRTLAYTTGTVDIEGTTYNYAEVSLYAYQLIGDITYSDGTVSGSYHINSYYDFITTDNEHKDDLNLKNLVEKLYNYCKSAEAYRAYVISK